MTRPISQLVPWTRGLIGGIVEALVETAEAVKARMAEEGKPVTYPIQWDSQRQKRAYFATNGFGNGIPYSRTKTYVLAGRVIKTPHGAQFYKPHPAGAIGGTFSGWQSRIHAGRWNNILLVLAEELDKLPERITDHVVVSGDRNVGG